MKMHKLFSIGIAIALIAVLAVILIRSKTDIVTAGAKQASSRRLVSSIPGVKFELVREEAAMNNLDKLIFDLVNETAKDIYFFELATAKTDKTTEVLGFYSNGRRSFKAQSRQRIERLVSKEFAVNKELLLRTVVFDDGTFSGLEQVGKKIVAERSVYRSLAQHYVPMFEDYGKASKALAKGLGERIIKAAKSEIEQEQPQQVERAMTLEQYIAGFAKNSKVNALLDIIHRVELIQGEELAGKETRAQGVKASIDYLNRFN